jgi:epoxyqueuosine reductase
MNSSAQPKVAFAEMHRIVAELQQCHGFDAAGVAADSSAPELDYFSQWVAEGRGGEMAYLARVNDSGTLKRSALRNALPWARSVIVCSCSYDSAAPLSVDAAPEGSGWIARYAQPGGAGGGPADYHDALLERLRAMEAALHERVTPLAGEFESRSYVDTGPVIERVFARYAGLGWIGKNTCLIDEQRGSWFFLAAMVTSLELEGWQPDALLAADRCGACTRCIDACPTGALDGPYRMDAARCIAYLTIEKKGSIAEELRDGIGRNVFGCDICQDVCPWNSKARREGKNNSAIFSNVREELVNPQLAWLGGLTRAEFKKYFRGSPLERTGWRRCMRNVAIAMGNSGREEFLERLASWSQAPDEPMLAEAARWASEKIQRNFVGG